MTGDEPVEIELKYRLADAAAGERLLAAEQIGPFAPAGPIETVETSDRFLDTADRAFAATRHAVRLRTAGATTTVTIKGPATPGPGGAHRRTEQEAAALGTDPADWPDSAARERVLRIAAGRPLVEVAALRQRRRHRLVRAGETIADLTVDEVRILDRDRTIERFVELEVELRAGDSERLAELAAAFALEWALSPSTDSKYAAALRALARETETR
jgi:inorganic triphosphatase YgiF